MFAPRSFLGKNVNVHLMDNTYGDADTIISTRILSTYYEYHCTEVAL